MALGEGSQQPSSTAGSQQPSLDEGSKKPSSSASSRKPSSKRKAKELEFITPDGKMMINVQVDGSVVGLWSKRWSTCAGDYVRTCVPICYKSWRYVPRNFKDDVWSGLMTKFKLDVPTDVARPLLEEGKDCLKRELPTQKPLSAKGATPSCLENQMGNKTSNLKIKSVAPRLTNPIIEEARALLGRLEYQRGNVEAALRVFDGVDLQDAIQRLQPPPSEKPPSRRNRSRGESLNTPPQNVATLVLEAIFLKAMSLRKLGKRLLKNVKVSLILWKRYFNRAQMFCWILSYRIEYVRKAVEFLPELWKRAGQYQETLASYRRALLNQWNLDDECCARIQRRFAVFLLYGGIEVGPPSLAAQSDGSFVPKSNLEEAILLLMIVLRKNCLGMIQWNTSVMEHLTFALSLCGQTSVLARHFEEVAPGTYPRSDKWYSLALCYKGAD